MRESHIISGIPRLTVLTFAATKSHTHNIRATRRLAID